MAELLPTRQAADLRRAVTDYVTTAISLADPSVDSALDAFLTDADSGIFLGPYLRTRLPFASSSGGVSAHELLPSLPGWFEPYAHQAAAFERLTTMPNVAGERDEFGFRIPEPTIVTTGTGSGKTESFLYPVLDHVARARAAGIGGIKALILYPMNALANDQASRLAATITENPAYRGISAALYTGEASAQPSTTVTKDRLITDRAMIRGSVPDILLTNYKMLDQLLLRRADRPLWDASGASLRYLVLDEFHTYDGAQGTDVGMLLRRLRMVLERSARGRVHLTPVATSATLGDGDHAADAMLSFARTVFGTELGTSAVITETREGLDEFTSTAVQTTALEKDGERVLEPVTPAAPTMLDLAQRHLTAGRNTDPQALLTDVLDALWSTDDEGGATAVQRATALGITPQDLALAHPAVRTLLATTRQATGLTDLARGLFPTVIDDAASGAFTGLLLAGLSHLRAQADRNSFPSLEAHLWLREITRVDRTVSTAPAFVWSDAVGEEDGLALPAIYCRHCGRSGWGLTTRAVGDDLDLRPDTIRNDSARRTGRFRAAILDTTAGTNAETSGDEAAARRRYLNLDAATLDRHGPVTDDNDSDVIPVLVHAGLEADDRSIDQSCPACGEKNGIRFLGTRLATLLSVVLTSIFGTTGLDLTEKKALVFTDSVQDAAHRAGFVEARSHSLSLRSVIHSALGEEPAPIDTIVRRMLEAATTPEQKYRLLHPTITDVERLEPFWRDGAPRAPRYTKQRREQATDLVRRRLAFDVGLELGLTGQVGRTLLLTGSALAQVRVTNAELDAVADRALSGLERSATGDETELRRRWVRGVLTRLRTRGAVSHPWLRSYRESSGMLYRLWGGRPDPDVMPAFPPGRAVPGLPSLGTLPGKSNFEDIASRGSWYTDWTVRALSRDRGVASSVLRPLFEALRETGILDVVEASDGSGLRSFALATDRLEAARPAGTVHDQAPALTCTGCRETVTGTAEALAQLRDGPCVRFRCTGTLRPHGITSSYYRTLYDGDMRRVVAREHTSLLDTEQRLSYETDFKNSATTPGAPNVLVATPTLEMGIDIGDLSTVLLASVPRTVASYLQRVGRAGRLTGNSLDITFVAGRGRAAGLFADPLDMLNGTVRAPGAYLSAEEILRRQFLASVMDALAGDDRIDPPTPQRPVLASSAPGTYLGALLEEMGRRGPDRVDEFLARFATGAHAWDGLTDEARTNLRDWALPKDGGSSGLETAIHHAVQAWNAERDELRRRREHVNRNLEELQKLPADEERAAALQALSAESLLISAEQEEIGDPTVLDDEERRAEMRKLRGSAGRVGAEVSALESAHWIGVLERFALLPNFTLVDDAVALDATLIWQDDDGRWQHEASTITRSGRPALTELAPGAHFYAHGRELEIDGVDIGMDGSALKETAFCPVCGLAETFTRGAPPVICPACGAREIGDPGQHRDVVNLTRVYSTMTRNRSKITDTSDDRIRTRFETAVSVSFNEKKAKQPWSVTGSGLGLILHRDTTLTRLNLGVPHQVAETIRISGEDRSAPGFLLCAECGHHDSDTEGNRPQDHQAWCSLRYAREGKNRPAILSRTMSTETVMLTVPREIHEDPAGEGIWNLVGILLLGIERRFGGSIGNLDLDIISHPTRHGEQALLLSDSVPGGTGYLMELADAQSVWDLFVGARDALRSCPCQDDGLAACHRCLLPHVPYSKHDLVRRESAIELLDMLLGPNAEEGSMTWDVKKGEVDTSGATDSDLERRFRRAFRAAVANLPGVSVATRSSDRGEIVTARLGGRTFTLRPQVDVAGTRPDFVLTWDGSDVQGIAVYTDGRTFHATSGNNRVADDAIKRMRLRRHGYIPLAVTHADLDEHAQHGESGSRAGLPALLVDRTVGLWAQQSSRHADLARLLTDDPLQLIVDVVRSGSTAQLRDLAPQLPQLFVTPGGGSSLTSAATADAETVALDLLGGRTPPPPTDGSALAVARASGELAVLALLKPAPSGLVLVLDDRPAAVASASFPDAWRAWGRLANLAQGSPDGHTIRLTTATLVAAGVDVGVDQAAEAPTAIGRVDIGTRTGPAGGSDPLRSDWQVAMAEAVTDTERTVLEQLASLGIEAPVVGEEFGQGIPLDIAWPDRQRAYSTEELDPRDRQDLEADGWVIVGPSTEDIAERLGLTGRTTS